MLLKNLIASRITLYVIEYLDMRITDMLFHPHYTYIQCTLQTVATFYPVTI